MSAQVDLKAQSQPDQVLLKAFFRACSELSVSKSEAANIIGVNRSTLSRKGFGGIDPQTKQGELSLHFVRLYRSLYAISGGDQGFMRHWFNTANQALGDSPRNLVQQVLGLVQTNEYLDAMRGTL